ncbi:threonine--tRNA ligase [Candidatus Parcubacteria bacterium]|nr:threonine--tRNA ligase [Candidatus Parcubacteria bacterium]
MENIEKIRHSLAHLLASAIMESYPKTKLGIGPAVENGFYYDMELPKDFTAEDLSRIEARMRELIKENQDFTGKKVTKIAAKKLFKDQPYKLELIKDIEDKEVGTYQNGAFLDLCKGGHVDNTKEIDPNAFKLTKLAGAYWKGSEKNKMLTRIYGVAFATKQELENYVKMQEEAEKRDHRVLGQKLDLFVFSDLVGPGLPLYTPKGTILRDELAGFSEQLQKEKGFQKVWIPHITKIDLYKTSGHWDKFGDELFLVKSQESSGEFALKPMNCPHHTQIYASKPRSYRELPLRYMETTTCYRDEKTGELSGLTRVRSLTQDDAHIFCTMEQVEQEFENIMEMIKTLYGKLGLEFKARLSFSDPEDPKYLGDKANWKKAEETLERIAKKLGLNYTIATGEAAFYGPKIDIMVIDALGREWQCATEQLDFVQPMRFGLEYAAEDGTKKTPVMIHKALLGTIDRFLGVYIEHTAGNFPLWLAPVQVAVIPISAEKHSEYADKVAKELQGHGLRFEVMAENESLSKKIRQAEMQHVPYLLIIGDKEIQANAVGVRERGKGDLGAMPVEEFLNKVKKEINNKS